MHHVLNVEALRVSEESATTNKVVELDPIILGRSALVKKDKHVIGNVRLLKGVSVGLAGADGANGLRGLDNTSVSNGEAKAVLSLAVEAAVEVVVGSTGVDENVVAAVENGGVERQLVVVRLGGAASDVDDNFIAASAAGHGLDFLEVEGDVEDGLEVDDGLLGHCWIMKKWNWRRRRRKRKKRRTRSGRVGTYTTAISLHLSLSHNHIAAARNIHARLAHPRPTCQLAPLGRRSGSCHRVVHSPGRVSGTCNWPKPPFHLDARVPR